MTNITSLPAANSIDPVNDVLAIVTNSLNATQKINRNTYLGLSSAPVGLNDSQTLTNKTLTSPTINGATLSGTLSGTYTLGGTPTFPSSVVTLTGSQTLTNKILTSPTVNTPTITNASITADTVSGFTTSNNGTIYGISITGGQIGNAALANNSVNTSQIASGIQLPDRMKNPYKFSVYRNSSYTLTASALTKMPFDTKEFDTGSNFDNVTNFRFTAPVAGFYWFSTRVDFSTTATRGIATFYVNGAETTGKRGTDIAVSASELAGVASAILSLSANDYVEVWYYTIGGTTQANVGNKWATYFQGFLVSAT
jgi:hypothetical protein